MPFATEAVAGKVLFRVAEGGAVNYVNDRRDHLKHRTAESHREKETDKSHAETQIIALISSTREAMSSVMGQMAKNPNPRDASKLQSKMNELQAVDMIANAMLHQLFNDGSANVAGISAAIASVQGDLTAEEDKKEEVGSSDTAAHVVKLPPEEVEATLGRQDIIIQLHRHAQTMHMISEESILLSDKAQTAVADGYADFKTTVAVAAALYDGKTPDELLAQTSTAIYQSQLEAGKTEEDARAIADNRTARIAEKARFIDEGTRTSETEGGRRMLEVFKEMVQDPAQLHIEESKAHFDFAVGHLGGSPQHRKLAAQMESWDGLQQETTSKFGADLADAENKLAGHETIRRSGTELYETLSKELDIDGGLMETATHIVEKSKALHNAHAGIYLEAAQHSLHLTQEAGDLFTGKRKDIANVAKSIGMEEKRLRLGMVKCRIDLEQPVGDEVDKLNRDRIREQFSFRQPVLAV